ncbi:MAG: hypothetical protein JWN78_2288 [Bacteroidota bacterium]|nr:hypothetical protein [Bacteroidota bacterium]
MLKKYFIFGLMAFYYPLKGQIPDSSSFQKRKLNKTEIELTLSYYHQNGNHSAVTGGIGTEKLNVYAPHLKIAHQNKLNTFALQIGMDVISSASTDNIDHEISSASLVDTHFQFDGSYQRKLKKTDLTLGIATGVAMESDYLALPVSASIQYVEPSKMRTYQIGFSGSFDDLRWGRLKRDVGHPVKLVYPVELRYKDWFDTYRRNTYALDAGFTQVLSKKMILGVFPGFIYQKGILATPFHRVYFNDNSERVENLPKQRFKFPLGIKLNSFLGKRFILKSEYSFYIDNFGVVGNAIEAEGAVKISPLITVSSFFRFYHQSASKYFAPYKEHSPTETFYTCDYDLSRFNNYKAGVDLKFSPMGKLQKKLSFDHILFRYAFFYRSDHMQMHMISMDLNISYDYPGRKNK